MGAPVLRSFYARVRTVLGRELIARVNVEGAERWRTVVQKLQRVEAQKTFLAETSRILAASLDADRTLRNMARAAVPELADWCQIDLLTADGKIETAAFAHRESEKEALGSRFVGRCVLDAEARTGIPAVIRSGNSQHLSRLSELCSTLIAPDDALLYEWIGFRSALTVPLRARGRSFGALTLVSADASRIYDDEDVAIAEDVAHRFALAYHNAQLYGAERLVAAQSSYVAERLQDEILPMTLPSTDRVQFSAWYRPEGEQSHVGGDWYNAVRLDEDRILFTLGDVIGHGLEAAIAMVRARQSILTAAMTCDDPPEILRKVNPVLFLQDSIVTAIVGLILTRTNEITFALAGHPPPILVSPEGEAHMLAIGGLPLGVEKHVEYERHSVPWTPGSVFIAYTDGLLDWNSIAGGAEQSLIDAAASLVAYDRDDLAEILGRRVIGSAALRDDVAIMTIALKGSPATSLTPVMRAL